MTTPKPCDWCRKPGATHTANDHPLPPEHSDYDLFYDASDQEFAAMILGALKTSEDQP